MLAIVICVSAATAATAAAEELSAGGWTGSVDSDGATFLGCHLDSPPASSGAAESIRVAAENPLFFAIQFASTPQPEQQIVRLGLANDERPFHDDWSSDHGYIVRTLNTGTMPDGRPFARELLMISSDDAIIPHLDAAQYLKIYLRNLNPTPFPLSYFGTIALRHGHSPASGGSDTAAAAAAVIACAKSHPFKIDFAGQSLPIDAGTQAEMQAKLDFVMAVEAMLGESAPTQTKMRQDLIDAGSFYCAAKHYIPYGSLSGGTYQEQVGAVVQLASKKLSELSFWPEGRTATDVMLADLSMSFADQYLCAGWPDHPRPPG
ncbi:MAG: hypothetical protein ABSE22_23345 [Xanthobacteraceae bacterium]|jgi:hypothetical protein